MKLKLCYLLLYTPVWPLTTMNLSDVVYLHKTLGPPTQVLNISSCLFPHHDSAHAIPQLEKAFHFPPSWNYSYPHRLLLNLPSLEHYLSVLASETFTLYYSLRTHLMVQGNTCYLSMVSVFSLLSPRARCSVPCFMHVCNPSAYTESV